MRHCEKCGKDIRDFCVGTERLGTYLDYHPACVDNPDRIPRNPEDIEEIAQLDRVIGSLRGEISRLEVELENTKTTKQLLGFGWGVTVLLIVSAFLAGY